MPSTTLTTAQVAGLLRTINKHFASANTDITDIGDEGADLTASRVLITDVNGDIGTSSVTSTELGYIAGLDASIAAVLDGKLDKPTVALVPEALKDDYTTGDLDSEAEVIAAINTTNATINDIIAILREAGGVSVET